MLDIIAQSTSDAARRAKGIAVTASVWRGVVGWIGKALGLGEATQLIGNVQTEQGWGRVPLLSLTTAFGLLLVASIQVTGAQNAYLAASSFWTGVVVILFPISLRITCPSISRREQLSIKFQRAASA